MDTFQTFLNACRNGQKNIVKILLERGGIDLNRRDAEGNTALHSVCRERAIARFWPDSSTPGPIRMPLTGRAARR